MAVTEIAMATWTKNYIDHKFIFYYNNSYKLFVKCIIFPYFIDAIIYL